MLSTETKKTISKLYRIKQAFSNNEISLLFIEKSLHWIADKANKNLDERTHHFWGSDARSWTKKIYSTFGILENNDMNSASIEFGIGRVGATRSVENFSALENSYEYDKPSEYKDENGYWTFKDARTGLWVRINGYVGKSFLYDAFSEYLMNKIWVELYKQAFDTIIGGICK